MQLSFIQQWCGASGSDLLTELLTAVYFLISSDQILVSSWSLSVETVPQGLITREMEVVINDSLMVPCLRLYKLTHLPSFLSLLYAAPGCSIIIQGCSLWETHILKQHVSWNSNHVSDWPANNGRELKFLHCWGFVDSWECTKMMATDALGHSRVKGFNMIIWSDDLEQIQCFKMPFRVVAKCVCNPYTYLCLCQKQYLDGVKRPGTMKNVALMRFSLLRLLWAGRATCLLCFSGCTFQWVIVLPQGDFIWMTVSEPTRCASRWKRKGLISATFSRALILIAHLFLCFATGR